MSDAVGFVGLGDIGLPIATRIQEALGPIAVWNRTPSKADTLVAKGSRLFASPKMLAQECSLVALCLTSDGAVEEVVFGTDGLLDGHSGSADLTIVNLSTGTPDRSRSFAERAAAVGAHWLDSPVSGGVPAAQTGALTLFLGGEAATVARAEPLLAAISLHRTLMGPPGAGQTTKLCNQMIVATNILAIAEAVSAGRKSGIDVSRFAEALAGGFADSKPLQIFGPRMADHIFEPRLGAIGLMLKDLDAARDMAARVRVVVPVTELVASLYRSVSDRPDLSLEQDIAALINLFEKPRRRGRRAATGMLMQG